MRAIVLAAGTGSRLGPLTQEKTKGMVKVSGKRLIDYLLNFFDIDLFTEIIVVGGFYYEDLKKHIEGKQLTNIKVIENKEYRKGNIFTLKRGLEEFTGDSFLITNVDHIYPPVMFKKMAASFGFITGMCDFDRRLGADDMKVKLRKDDRIQKISKQLDDFECGYIGMTYVDSSMENTYRNTIEAAIAHYGENAVVENILQILADDNATAPKICDLSGFGWYEVDTEEDLMNAEKGLLVDNNF